MLPLQHVFWNNLMGTSLYFDVQHTHTSWYYSNIYIGNFNRIRHLKLAIYLTSKFLKRIKILSK